MTKQILLQLSITNEQMDSLLRGLNVEELQIGNRTLFLYQHLEDGKLTNLGKSRATQKLEKTPSFQEVSLPVPIRRSGANHTKFWDLLKSATMSPSALLTSCNATRTCNRMLTLRALEGGTHSSRYP